MAETLAAEAVRLSHAEPALGSEPEAATPAAPSALTPEAEAFRKAKGEVEFEIDSGKVNTTGGWRDVKIGLFAKREHGSPCPPEEWTKRKLPRPTVRVAFTAIDSSDHFGPECRAWAARPGIRETSKISVVADGADWIWVLVLGFLCGARRLLDVFHAAENVAKASKALFGAGTPEAGAWQDRVMLALLSQGWQGLCREVGAILVRRRAGAGGAGRIDQLLRPAHVLVGLPGASASGRGDRQRDGGGLRQDDDQQAAEGERGTPAGQERDSHGGVVLAALQR